MDYEVYDDVLHSFDDEDEELDIFYEDDFSYDEDVFNEENEEYTVEDPEKIIAGFEGWVISGRDQFQCKVTSKNKKKKTAFVKFYLEDGLSKQKQLVNLSDFIVVEEEEFDY